ncbi:hypothetical protein [Nonomuraea typhae]|uniref:hypothetical protein n=1 Tax=Nonomuraea typhae TaxID=2603600 RepID=UPI0012FAC534|nr:hypothetical protein [Nonomuraea typhae]
MTTTPPPSPPAAAGEAAFMAGLRDLKTWSGFSFRQLERRAAAAGEALPSSTAASMLGRDRVPRAALLAVFTRACGLDEEQVGQWVTARERIFFPPPPPRAAWWRPVALAVVAMAAAFTAISTGPSSTDVEETVVVTSR